MCLWSCYVVAETFQGSAAIAHLSLSAGVTVNSSPSLNELSQGTIHTLV